MMPDRSDGGRALARLSGRPFPDPLLYSHDEDAEGVALGIGVHVEALLRVL